MSLALIAAIARDGAIGKDGGLPWGTLQADRRWFWRVTRSRNPYEMARRLCDHPTVVIPEWQTATSPNACIMGRRTWETLPVPLVGRLNLVVMHAAGPALPDMRPDFYGSLDMALTLGALYPHTFIIGGAQVYDAALRLPELETLYLTLVDGVNFPADTCFPQPINGFSEMWRDDAKVAWDRSGKSWACDYKSQWIQEKHCPQYQFQIWTSL